MSLPYFFFERVTSEIHQQMEGVLALAERLERQHLSPDALACVEGVAEAASAVRKILGASMELHQASGENLVFDNGPVRLRDLADMIQQKWEAEAPVRGVTLLVSYDGDPEAAVIADSRRLVQVFDGLIGQAMAGVRRGVIEASLRATGLGDYLNIEGRVRGGGDRNLGERALDLREIEALFGLEIAIGMALGQRIVEAHGGRLRAEPNRGGGETLIFEMAAPVSIDAVTAPEPVASSRAAHILVVDDNATNRTVAQTLCEMFDCTSEAAVDGVEALDVARSGRFDLILMDIKMPRMDGVTATKEIRMLPGPAGRVPIIALTANADPEDAAAYLRAGMNDVVEKPMKPEVLLRALQENLIGEDPASAAA
jgi:CheY-like chemotaxis protein